MRKQKVGTASTHKMCFMVCILFVSFISDSVESDQTITSLEQIFSQSNESIDFGLAALVIEKYSYPKTNIDQALREIEKIVSTVKRMPEYGDSSLEKMGAVLRYFYTPSQWNNHRVYQYDLDDLRGEKNPVSTLSYLLKSRYGNCISLPTLVTIVGQRVGVDIKLAIAASHVFAHFKDEDGRVTNIEATSGTLLSDSAYIRNFDIHPDAIKNQVYLQSLSNKQALAVLIVELGRKYMHQSDYENALKIADLALSHHPKLPKAMLLKGNVYNHLLQNELARLKSINQPIGHEQRQYLDPLYEQNLAWFNKAEILGWREPPPDFEERYKASIERFKSRR